MGLNNIKTEIKDRLSFETVGLVWRKARNISGSLALFIGVINQIPLNIPPNINEWLKWATIALTFIATGSHLNKSNK